MRILITGGGGMLATEVAAALVGNPNHHEFQASSRHDCDVTDPGSVRAAFERFRPEALLHLAAYADVDGCERDPALAMRVNAEGARHVAQACAQAGARLVYLSTDYVFDGARRQPYTEQDAPNPLSAYGRSKLEGERAAGELANSLVVRTSGLYGRNGRHFVGAILEQARLGKPLRVVHDQVVSPTWTRPLARALVALVSGSATGIVHAASSGGCSWFDFARAILKESGIQTEIRPITTLESNRAAQRPAYSVLDSSRLERLGVAPLPTWQDSLRQFLRDQRQGG